MAVVSKLKSFFQLVFSAISGEGQDFTQGSINRAIFLLSIPMVFEMGMESVFAVVDIYFVTRLDSSDAVAVIGLTESMLALVYSLAWGVSMGATALVARRVGEKNFDGASSSAVQAIVVGLVFSFLISVTGFFFYEDLLRLMGASEQVITTGSGFTKWMLTGNLSIMLLFLINGIFRGAGDAVTAMLALIIANVINMILDPILIFGWGVIPAFGVEGAAISTTIGRSIGVLFQLSYLFSRKGIIKIKRSQLGLDWKVIRQVLNVSAGATGQFLISSASWVFLARIISHFGSTAMAGYTIAIRVIIFTILPSWGMANAAATLVGQNLGANQPERAEKSVWKAGFYNMIFLAFVMVIFLFLSAPILHFFTKDEQVIEYGTQCLRIVALGYLFYGYGMVITQSFNGAGDTRTPTMLNLFGFWCFQIPLAYLLAITFEAGPNGVYAAIAIAESAIAVAGILLFRRGRWKTVKV